MRKHAVISLVLGTIALTLVILVVIVGTSSFDGRIIAAMDVILAGSEDKVSAGLINPRERLFRLADSITSREGVGRDVRALISGVPPPDSKEPSVQNEASGANNNSGNLGFLDPGNSVMGSLFAPKLSTKERLNKIRKKYLAGMRSISAKHEAISGIMIADARGTILLSRSEGYEEGKKTLFKGTDLYKQALGGSEAYGIVISEDGQIMGVALAPLGKGDGPAAGVLVLIERIKFAWETTGINLFFVRDDEIVAGERLNKFSIPDEFSSVSFGLASFTPVSYIVGVGAANLKAMFIPRSSFMLRAREVVVPGDPQLRGFVSLNPVNDYGQLGGVQYTVILLTLGLWLLGIILTNAYSKRYLESGDKIANLIGARFQGTIADKVDDSEFPEEFARLNKLVGQLVDEVDSKGSAAAEEVLNEMTAGLEFINEGSLATFSAAGFLSGGQLVNLGELAFSPHVVNGELVKPGSIFREGAGGSLALESDDGDFDYPTDDREAKEESSTDSLPPPLAQVPPLAQDFNDIYKQYIDVRKSCGQSTEVASGAFMERLKETEEAVKAQHQCADVNFEVYVKDGKAALRASPGST